ncbi:P-loop containing protein [Fusarium beomiforme]|uniref:P-loop containing protein n=1 Tax=Fusarium beomiforme TaxID=44412 RepID=A0A9P5AEC1_9HYPO|nr:P-loop containing protein [Fusarium beomiforme]
MKIADGNTQSLGVGVTQHAYPLTSSIEQRLRANNSDTYTNDMASRKYIPNIYIIGPQSTGKTTLVNKLRSDLEHPVADTLIVKPQIVSEVARTVLRKHKFSAKDIWTSTIRCLELQQLILEAQAVAEKEALNHSSWFVSDRSGLDCMAYAKRYAAADAIQELQKLPAWTEVKARMEKSLIVVCEAGTPCLADDGVRLMPTSEDDWMELFHEFCQLLDDTGLEYFVVPRTLLDLSERAELVHAKWNEKWQSVKHNQVDGP